ncbi:MAG: hypothetical protein H6Q18_862, partial [Bacteroidetes bacterium]|nr:hypothetical protein [Bacteroidota bacterium]
MSFLIRVFVSYFVSRITGVLFFPFPIMISFALGDV